MKWIRLILNLLNWLKWRRRAKDAEATVILNEETYDVQTKVSDEGDTVTRPSGGSDDDLLNSGGSR